MTSSTSNRLPAITVLKKSKKLSESDGDINTTRDTSGFAMNLISEVLSDITLEHTLRIAISLRNKQSAPDTIRIIPFGS